MHKLPTECDGSCFLCLKHNEEIMCEDGKLLVFILCLHSLQWFLSRAPLAAYPRRLFIPCAELNRFACTSRRSVSFSP
jgi:hypothetical protein